VKDLDLDLLDRLTRAPGISGNEEIVAHVVREAIPQTGWEVRQDALGNLAAHLPGSGRRVALVAHMDEVGLIVRRITPQGFLLVERMGGMNLQALPGSRMTLWIETGRLPVQVGLLPQHLDKHTTPDLKEIYIDIGADSIEQVREMGVSVGDVLTWDSPLTQLGRSRISSKALDDRLGCFTMLSLAQQIQPAETACDLWLVFITREEIMLNGALPFMNKIAPDVLIGVDGTLPFDTPDLENGQCDIRLGAGPAVKWMDAIRGKGSAYIADYPLARKVRAVARQLEIPLQDEVVTGISTSITALAYAAEGAPAIGLSLPIRYHHSPVEMADLNDVRHLVRLLKELVTRPW